MKKLILHSISSSLFAFFIYRFFAVITHGSRFVQKWKIVEIDHANGLTFVCIFNLFKQGSVAGIVPFPWPLEDGNCCNDLKDFEVILTTIFVGKNPDSLIECGTHLEGDLPPVLLKIHCCYDPMESLYYSCGYKNICVYCSTEDEDPGDTPFIQMIGMIVIFFRGCNRRFGIF